MDSGQRPWWLAAWPPGLLWAWQAGAWSRPAQLDAVRQQLIRGDHIFESPWLIGAAAVLAGSVAAVSGFGIGSLLTPLLLLSMSANHAVAILAIPHAIATGLRWFRLRTAVHRPTFQQFGIASAIGGLMGALLQSRLASPVLTVVLASLIVVAGTSEVLERRIPLRRTPVWRLLGGGASGFFGGLVGNQGGIRTAALLGFQLEPRQLVATATASALIVDAARIPIYLISEGKTIGTTVPLWVAASVGAIVGTLLGVPILSRIPPRTYHRLLGVLLVVLGFALFAAVV